MLEQLYRQMARSRAFELALADAWHAGRISGELHLGTGEEAIAAGITAHLQERDSMALDHRGTPPLVTAGADLRALMAEMLGHEDGLCRGRGGHMHLFSRTPFAVSSGIVGAAGPAAVGFSLASRQLRPGGVSIAFFGDGAANQGALLESFNLAAAWRIGVVFVCKDNGWAITTRSESVTGGDLCARARGFGLDALAVDGGDVEAMHEAAGHAIERAREGVASFLLASCPRLDGHFLGDKMVRVADNLTGAETRGIFGASLRGALSGGAPVRDRARGLLTQMGAVMRARGEQRGKANDPLDRARSAARRAGAAVDSIDDAARDEVAAVVEATSGGYS